MIRAWCDVPIRSTDFFSLWEEIWHFATVDFNLFGHPFVKKISAALPELPFELCNKCNGFRSKHLCNLCHCRRHYFYAFERVTGNRIFCGGFHIIRLPIDGYAPSLWPSRRWRKTTFRRGGCV